MESVEEIRRSIRQGAPALIQKLKDDRSGVKRITTIQRKAAMMLLRKVMTLAQIRAEVNTVQEVPRPKVKARRKAKKR